MQNATFQRPEIEPFEFKNRSTYRDLLRLLTSIREVQKKAPTELSQKFLTDFFNALFFIAKEVSYSSLDDNNKMFKMNLLEASILKTFDCMTALEVCFEARWISAPDYFKAKQILEKTYWTFKDQQKITGEILRFYSDQSVSHELTH